MDPTFGDLAELRNKMLRWARKLTRGGHQAEDLVQESLLRMLANRHKAPAVPAQVDPWARTFLTNVWLTERRNAGRRPQFVDYDQQPLTAAEDPFTAVYCRQVCRYLGLDRAMLLAEPEAPMSVAQRVRRHRVRLQLEARAA